MRTIDKNNVSVILSRKGFDSTFGRRDSFILGDDLIFLPIPSCIGKQGQNIDTIKYSDFTKKYNGKKIIDIMKDTFPKQRLYRNNSPLDLTDDTYCHFDPDLAKDYIKRKEGWRGTYGQNAGYQTFIAQNIDLDFNKTNSIKPTLIFLFYGSYRKIESISNFEDKKYKYISETKSDGKSNHIVFGYLIVDEVVMINSEEEFEATKKRFDWLIEHPHMNYIEYKPNNCIYIAEDEVIIGEKKVKGYGMFKYNDLLVLTKKNSPKSQWDNIKFEMFDGLTLLPHKRKWHKNANKPFKTVSPCQEYIFQNDGSENYMKMVEWVLNLISNQNTIS